MSRGPWMDALEVQADLVQRLINDPIARLLADSYDAGGIHGVMEKDDGTVVPLALADWQVLALARSQTYWVSDEMMDVTDAAAETLDTSEGMTRDELPAREGFALLQRPRRAPDARGQILSTSVLSWSASTSQHSPTGPGVVFTLWSDIHDEEDACNLYFRQHPDPRAWETIQRGGRYQIMHVGWLPFDTPLDEHLDFRTEDSDIGYGGEHPLLPPDQRQAIGVAELAWIRTFWKLVEQRVGHQREEQPDRATARRLARTTQHAPDRVTVVTLRRFDDRKQPEIDGEHHVEWSHRWIRRGHWRWQPYPSLGPDVRKQIWIAPAVCGPEDKPLIIKPRVYRWTR